MAIITRWRIPPENSCGILVHPALRLGDSHHPQQLHGTGLGLFFAQLGVVAQVLNDLVAHGHGGVQGRQRVLEHHGHLAAAVGAAGAFR